MAEKRKLAEVEKRTPGTLIIIGGHEDREIRWKFSGK